MATSTTSRDQSPSGADPKSTDGAPVEVNEFREQYLASRKEERSHKPAGAQHFFDRARKFDIADKARELGIMPYFRELTRNDGATAIFDGRSVIMLGSNNYLGLTADPRVRKAAADATIELGPSLTGSRLLNGSTRQQRTFERRLAEVFEREDGLVFTTGYQANVGILSALSGEGCTLLLDKECHASIWDGARVGKGQIQPFRHNDLANLEELLDTWAAQSPCMVIVDGVYSMGGEIVDLPKYKELCSRYDVPIMVDDAHGLGVIGPRGLGTEDYWGQMGMADILNGTFSKSMASIGGWVVGTRKVIDWIRFHGRSMLFSASIAPGQVAAAATALEILLQEPWRVKKLAENAIYWREGLRKAGFNVGHSKTPIVPVVVGDDMNAMVFGKELLEAGVYVNVAVYPAVPRDSALLRTSVMATHETSQLDEAIQIVTDVGKRLGVIN